MLKPGTRTRSKREAPTAAVEPAKADPGKPSPPWGPPPRALYALTCYTIEKRKGRWYVIKTNVIGHRAWRGPYADLNRATLAIARLYQLEVTERHARRSELYSVPE